eukprot:4150819-Amphidinium_carterae.1
MSEYLHVNVDIQPCPQTIGSVLTCDLRPMRVLDCQSLGEAGASSWRVSLGVYRTPEEWVEEASRACHPFDSSQGLRADVTET